MTPRRFYNPQLDLFLPNIVDLRFRDQKDTMERPFFSLSKSKRMKPIEYENDNDGIFVTVQPHQMNGPRHLRHGLVRVAQPLKVIARRSCPGFCPQ